MKYIAVLLVLTLLVGCDNKSTSGVKNAIGDTPVKYVICSLGETNCFVAARFKDLDGCQSHKDWADMLCDNVTTPGKMTCAQDNGPKIAIAYCTL